MQVVIQIHESLHVMRRTSKLCLFPHPCLRPLRITALLGDPFLWLLAIFLLGLLTPWILPLLQGLLLPTDGAGHFSVSFFGDAQKS